MTDLNNCAKLKCYCSLTNKQIEFFGGKMTSIKACLGKKEERLRYPESYGSKQMKSAEKILEFFKDIGLRIIGEQSLEVRLEDKNTVKVMPLRGDKIISVVDTDAPDTHIWDGKEKSLILKPKKRFKKKFPQTLIIRRFFTP